MSAPALALLMARGVLRAAAPWRVSIAALLVGTSAVSWCQQRFDPTRPDWRSAAQHIEHERSVHPGPAGIVYSQTLRRPEHIADDSPASVEGLVDLTAGPPENDETRWFFRERRTPASASVVDSTAGLHTVLYVGAPGEELDDLAEALSGQGFAAVGEHRFRGERHDRDHGSVVTFAR
jgi:hypothetical protein